VLPNFSNRSVLSPQYCILDGLWANPAAWPALCDLLFSAGQIATSYRFRCYPGDGELRILTFTSLYPNSLQPSFAVFVHQRTEHLSRLSGNSVQVVAPVPYFPLWIPLGHWQRIARIPGKEQLGELTVRHPRYLLVPKVSMRFHGRLMYGGCESLVRQLHARERFDCIDAHFVYPDGFAACLLGKMLGVPVIVSARGTDLTLYPSFRTIRPLIEWTLDHAAGLIAVSASLKNEMLALGANRKKIRVIANGVDINRFQATDRGFARRQLGLSVDAQIVVSVGALLPVKGHDRLIAAIAAMKDQFPRLRAYIVGEGSERARLESQIREAGIAERVFLVGSKPNDELQAWFNAADVSCLASSREGWPNVVSESIACGTAVVATNVGGVQEIISSPELGIVVEPELSAIARGLADALRTHWNRDVMVEHAQQRTWETVAHEVQEHLDASARGHTRNER